MYEAFFGLQKSPFKMAPDPDVLFPTMQHREALAGIAYAIMSRKGLVVLTGEAGTGKTTLLSRVLRLPPPGRVRSSIILHPTVTVHEFLEMVMLDFGLQRIPTSTAQRLHEFRNFLIQGHKAGQISVLIVDEAHKLSTDVLEEIRLLSNFECEDKLLQVVLLGQSELDQTLNRDDLRQLKQRIVFRWRLKPLSDSETTAYIQYRWAKAGGHGAAPFQREALAAVSQYSRNVPRLVNTLCDNALLAAFAGGSRHVELRHIEEAARDLDVRLTIPVSPAAEGQPPASLAARVTGASQPIAPPVRVPQFCDAPVAKPSRLARWVNRLGLAG